MRIFARPSASPQRCTGMGVTAATALTDTLSVATDRMGELPAATRGAARDSETPR